MEIKTVIEKIKELIKKGNVSKIIVRYKGDVLLSIPVNLGVVGTVVGLAASKWAVLAAVLGTVGFGCTVELVKDTGEIVDVMTEQDTQKARDAASDIFQDVKSVTMNFINQMKEDVADVKASAEEPEAADFEQVVDESEPKD